MNYSKSFGYALRGILYVAVNGQQNNRIRIEDISGQLGVPRHFMAKVMKRVVKEGILQSTKGPYGGLSLSENTMQTKLIKLIEITEGMEQFDTCILRFKHCHSKNPCPLHGRVDIIRKKYLQLFSETRIADLLKEENPNFIKGITAS